LVICDYFWLYVWNNWSWVKHIFTSIVPTFHSRYRRYVLITNEFHEFCRFTISGTSDDGKTSYGLKSMHIIIVSKIRHSHRQVRGWHGTMSGPNRAKVGLAGPTSLAGRPGFGIFFENHFIHVSREVGGVGQWRPKSVKAEKVDWLATCTAGRPSAPNRLKLMVEILLTFYKYPHPISPRHRSVKKVRFSFL
jgi:hypothetical protein